MLLQDLLEITPRMAGGMGSHLLRRSRHHDLATFIAAFRTEVNDSVRAPDDVEVLPDEKQATTVGLLLRAVVWFDGQGISCKRVPSDNGSAYRSKPWREACSAIGLKPKRTRPYTPRTNGKAERLIKTLLAEWAYSMAFQTSTERNRWLPRDLAIHNSRRCHIALARRTPFQQLGLLRATE